jgi:hypothetical protein
MPTRARKKSSSKAPALPSSSTAAADTATALASQLLDDTISLAVEDDATADAATFAAFIVDMLPPEVLETLKAVAGFDVDDVEPPSPSHSTSSSSSSSSTVNAQDLAFLSEVWAERVAPDDPLPGGGGASTLCSSYECELCDRVIQTTRHHLHPRETHAWLQTRDPAHYTDTLLGTTVNLCRMVRLFSFLFERLRCGRHFFSTVLLLGVARRQCHSAVHRFYPNRVLAEEYYTLELLLSRYVKLPTVSTFSLFYVSLSQRQGTCFCQVGLDVARPGQLAHEVTTS